LVSEPAPVRAIRRPSAVVRGLLLDAAQKLFAERGFAGASTREIAALAGVREALIFRHFGNKSGLFHAAVVEPFRNLIEEFVDRWEAEHLPRSLTTEELTGAWISALYTLMREHRELVVTLVAAHAFDGETAPDGEPFTDAFARPMDRMERFTRRELAGRGLTADPTITVRALFGMVMSMAVLDDWFFSGVTRPPARARVIAQMTDVALHGIIGRSPSSERG